MPVALYKHVFRFGDTVVYSLGLIEVAFSAPGHILDIIVLMDVVPVNVPALLDLDVRDAERIYAHNVTNLLVHRSV